VKVQAAEAPFKVDDQSFSAGSLIIRTEGNGEGLRKQIGDAVGDLGLEALAVDKLPEVKSHELATPRIAILHTWTNTQNDGWFRIEFDRYKVPYSYISVHVLRDTPDLKKKYDVIIFPPVGGSPQSIVNGLPKRGDPIPRKGSPITPNMAGSPDTSSDIRGGIELRGMVNLQKFIEDGGLFVTIAGNSQLPIDYGITTGITIEEPKQLQARGSVYTATISDKGSPIAYGYGDTLPVYFSQTPLFNISSIGGTGGRGGGPGAGGAQGRPSGRGSLTDPDVIQGMPLAAPRPPQPPAAPGEEEITDEVRRQLGPLLTPPSERPRVIVRFASDEKNLLISGMLAGGSELTNRPAVVDVPVGKGHVVMFANNPMWRHQTQGSFFLLFNACLNYDNLGVGRTAANPRRARQQTGEENDQ
jgi:hypothetical protein